MASAHSLLRRSFATYPHDSVEPRAGGSAYFAGFDLAVALQIPTNGGSDLVHWFWH
jgi:hypothetical protein